MPKKFPNMPRKFPNNFDQIPDYTGTQHHPEMAKFHEEISSIVEQLLQAQKDGLPEGQINALEQEKLNIQEHYYNKFIYDYANDDKKLAPMHHHIEPDFYAKAQRVLNEQLAIRGKPDWHTSTPKSDITSELRALTIVAAEHPPDEKGIIKIPLYKSDKGEEQSRYIVETYNKQGVVVVYTIFCGPRLCGIVAEDGTCPHAPIVTMEIPPEWVDGKGWENGNPFQLGHEGTWEPTYEFDEQGRRTGPLR
jgi:hypothetical protein